MPGIFRSLRADAAGAPHPGPGHEPTLRRKSFFTPAQSATGMANTRNQSFLAKISAAAAMPASQPLLAYFTPMAEASTPSTPISATRSPRAAEHQSELQSLMRISYAVLCLTTKNQETPH